MLLEKTKEEILEIILNNISTSTNIQNISPASFIYKLANALSEYQIEIQEIWNKTYINSLLQYASGEYLDAIGASMGVYRKYEDYGRVYSSDKIFCFYVDTGTFGDINNNNSIIIPAGTQIYSNENLDGEQIYFIITSDIVLLPNESKHYFSAESSTPGEINLVENTVVNHTFANYTFSNDNLLKVTNEKPISIGQYVESDADYRYRIYNALSEFATGNKIAITLKLMSIPGVSDIKIIDFERGAGSTSVYIVPKQPGPNNTLIKIASYELENIKSLGTDLRVYNPSFLGIELEVELVFTEDTQNSEKPLIRENVKNNLIEYINNIPIGNGIILQQLQKVILDTDSRILRVGNSDYVFNVLNVYRDTAYNNRVPFSVISDLYIEPYEKIVCEYTINNPIRVI